MPSDEFRPPEMPSMTISSFTYDSLRKNAPNFVKLMKWRIRIWASLLFLSLVFFAHMVCLYLGLAEDGMLLIVLAVFLLMFLVCVPLITMTVTQSPTIRKRAKYFRKRYYLTALSKTPLYERQKLSKRIRAIFYEEEWAQCILLARMQDQERSDRCCKEIGKIAAYLCSEDPKYYTQAVLNVLNHQRGGLKYYFDSLSVLANQQFNAMNKKQMRLTQRLLFEDSFFNQ